MTLASFRPEPPEADFSLLPAMVERTIPSDVEAEQALLASVLLSGEVYFSLTTMPEEFYLEKHRWMFEAMQQVASTGARIEPAVLCSRLEQNKKLEAVGGAGYVARLVASVPTSSNAPYYAEAIRRAWTRRGLVQVSTEVADIAYNCEDVPTEQLIPLAYSKLLRMPQPRDQNTQSFDNLMNVWYPELLRYREEKRDVWGSATGFDFDPYIGGLQRSELMLLTGYAGIGKTSMGLQIGVELAKRSNPTVIFSLEMSARSLALRLVTEQSNVNSEVVRRGRETYEQMMAVDQWIARHRDIPLFINDREQTVASMHLEISRLKAMGIEIGTAIVDYARLVRSKVENEAQRIVGIMQGLKQLAKSEDIAVVAIHALNRDLTRRVKDADGRAVPTLGSLAYGGEYDADVVALVDYDQNRQDLLAYFYLLKNRNGRLGRVIMTYNPELTKWANLDKEAAARLRSEGVATETVRIVPVEQQELELPATWEGALLE